jgi:uncharacterized protein (UPF0276 family)
MSELRGWGLGFRPQHYKLITETLPRVDLFEIITENFMGFAPRPKKFLEKLRSHYPVATHGVSLSITSLEPLDREYLGKLSDFVSWLEPEIVSDHLCWTTFDGRNSHDLLPTPYTKSNLENVISKINHVQDVLRRQFVFENPSAYVAFAQNEMGEAAFFTELVKRTGCGILLDINNSYVNWKNLGWDPLQYFLELPHDSVKQFHLAGHSVQNGILIDTHDHPVPEGVWDLYKKALGIWPKVPTLLEWDEKIPEFEVLMSELEKARAMTPEPLEKNFRTPLELRENAALLTKKVPATAYGDFFETVTGEGVSGAKYLREDLPVTGEKGIEVYSNAYFLRLEGVLKDLFPTLAWIAEEDGFTEIASQYLKTFPPEHYSINYVGQNMAKFLNSFEIDLGVPKEALRDIAAMDWAYVELFETPGEEKILPLQELSKISPADWEKVGFKPTTRSKIIDLDWDIGPTWKSVSEGEDPKKPKQEKCSYLIWTKNGHLQNQKIPQSTKTFLSSLGSGKSFKEAVIASESSPEEGVKLLAACISNEMITGLRLP